MRREGLHGRRGLGRLKVTDPCKKTFSLGFCYLFRVFAELLNEEKPLGEAHETSYKTVAWKEEIKRVNANTLTLQIVDLDREKQFRRVSST